MTNPLKVSERPTFPNTVALEDALLAIAVPAKELPTPTPGADYKMTLQYLFDLARQGTADVTEFPIALSVLDEFVVSSGKVATFRAVTDKYLHRLKLYCSSTDASTSGDVLVDVLLNGSSILDNPLRINQGQTIQDPITGGFSSSFLSTNNLIEEDDEIDVVIITTGSSVKNLTLSVRWSDRAI